jgi:hypothetical protein
VSRSTSESGGGQIFVTPLGPAKPLRLAEARSGARLVSRSNAACLSPGACPGKKAAVAPVLERLDFPWAGSECYGLRLTASRAHAE